MKITVDERLKPSQLWHEMAQHLERLLGAYSSFGDYSVCVQCIPNDTLESVGSRLALVTEDNTASVSLDHQNKTITFDFMQSEMEKLDNDQGPDVQNPRLLAEVAVDIFDQIIMGEEEE